MAATTALLGLVTPVQGSLTGLWGDTVNYGISDYVDIAIAGTLSFAGDGAITLANTTGSAAGNAIGSTTAQYMVIRVTGTQTVTKVITGPSYSKLYMVDHAGATSAVTFKAAGQTGVSIAVGEKCFVYYNGTDYIKVNGVGATVSSVNASGGTTGLTFSGGPITGAGTLTMSGTLGTANGGTGSTSTTFANLATNVTGTLPIANGGTGSTSTTFVNLASNVTGTLPVTNGGTGATTITGLVKGNGTGAMTAAVAGTDYAAATPANTYVLTGNGAGGFSNAPAPISGYVLGYNGSAYQWVVAPSAINAANLAGGGAYTVVYQTSVGSTAYLTNGTTGQVLTANTSGAPTWEAAVSSFQTSLSGLTPSTSTTGAVTLAGTLGTGSGGTNSTATPTAGTVAYGTGTAIAYTATGTLGQVLTSAVSGAPTWTTITVPPPTAQGFVTQFTGGNTSPTRQSSGFGLI